MFALNMFQSAFLSMTNHTGSLQDFSSHLRFSEEQKTTISYISFSIPRPAQWAHLKRMQN